MRTQVDTEQKQHGFAGLLLQNRKYRQGQNGWLSFMNAGTNQNTGIQLQGSELRKDGSKFSLNFDQAVSSQPAQMAGHFHQKDVQNQAAMRSFLIIDKAIKCLT